MKGRSRIMKKQKKPGLIERLSKIPYTGAISDILDEMGFRFDRRKSSTLFLDTIRHMATADPLTFEKLTA